MMNEAILGEAEIGITTFFASAHATDTCGTNGLPLTPNSVRILGKFQMLKNLQHPKLCQYIEILRGRHERLVIVSEHCKNSLMDHLNVGDLASLCEIQQIAFTTVEALVYLHSHDITVRNLSPDSIKVSPSGKYKVGKYGMYHMTGYGSYVAFPVGSPPYLAPEVIANGFDQSDHCSFPSHGGLWSSEKRDISKIFRKLLHLIIEYDSVDALEDILKYSNAKARILDMDRYFVSFLKRCLTIDAAARPTAEELLKHEFLHKLAVPGGSKHRNFNGCLNFPAVYRSKYLDAPDYNKLLSELSDAKDEDHLTSRPIKEFYFLWTLAGGDVMTELKRHGLMKSNPPSLSMPVAVLNNGESYGLERERERMLDETTVAMSLDKLRQKLQNVDESAYYPLIVEDELNPADLSETAKLPLVIREKDVVYQFHRVILFDRLLAGYPFTRERIIKEARVDIPPTVRAKVWAALLNIQGDVQEQYDRIDKVSVTSTDRQIEVDIPRCHQYNQLLSSPTAHGKFKRILKAWVVSHPKLTYWQGLDSLCAPFLSLNFNDEALAYASLSAFIPKYLYNFFLKDNSPIIQEYLAVFSQMIAYHEPELYNHLSDIGFAPELYAIPWFLTMFSHVFPLHKIYYLWDTLLLGSSLLPLCIGVAILQQVKDQLIHFGFNECILLFSDMPGIDIEKTVKDSIKLFNHTPPSAAIRKHENPAYRLKAPEEEKFLNLPDKEFLSLEQLRAEVCPRISARDLVRISTIVQKQEIIGRTDMKELKKRQGKPDKTLSTKPDNRSGKVLIVDIRSPEEYAVGYYKHSINIPYEQAFNAKDTLSTTGNNAILQKYHGKMVMIIGNKGEEVAKFGAKLVQLNFRRVSVMGESVNILRNNGYFETSLISS
eukprot:gene7217-8025_t